MMNAKPVINSTDISITAAIIKLSDIFIGPDTGTMHIANALQKPLIALFGATSERDCGPLGNPDRVKVIKKEFDCSPCVALKESEQRDKCTAQGVAECMRAIPFEDVYDNVKSLLKI